MECNACGAIVKNGLDTCPYCGNAIVAAAPAPAAEAPINFVPVEKRSSKSGADIYEENIKAVHEVSAYTNGRGGCGTCFFISEDGYALTNVHVVTEDSKPADTVSILIDNRDYKATIVALGDKKGGHGDGIDAALIKLKDYKRTDPVKLGSSSTIRPGETVYYIGNSKGEGLCITKGIISDAKRKSGKRTVIMTDAATNPGNSGSPVFNENGDVIGIHMSARIDADGMKYAVPIDDVKEMFKQWIK